MTGAGIEPAARALKVRLGAGSNGVQHLPLLARCRTPGADVVRARHIRDRIGQCFPIHDAFRATPCGVGLPEGYKIRRNGMARMSRGRVGHFHRGLRGHIDVHLLVLAGSVALAGIAAAWLIVGAM